MADRREELEKYGLYDPRFEHDACGVGFVCDIKGRKSNQIVLQALEVLGRLSHRGATGADPKTGDGAGILLQMPHAFFAKECARQGISLPAEGEYGSGLVFLPREEKERSLCKKVFSRIIREESQKILGWRKVPVDDSSIGELARQTQPAIEQVFISRGGEVRDQLDFERKLYLIRKRTENELRKEKASFYITNLSSRTFSYKGLLMPKQLDKFFPDLKEESLQSALCIIHSRYSTNTFPTWDLAQPFRFLAHNGEINTLRGNINWMSARQALLESALFGRELKKIFPVIVPGGSDSAALDNVFELLVLSGRPMLHAMMMLIPSAWERSETLSQKMKDFYRYHACVMEPWDGPAAIAFTDGSRVGAVLDRNGLRPARYVITRQDTVIMASEAGVSDIAPEDILTSGRLEPGKFFYIDTQAGRIVDERKVLEVIAGMQPYGAWLKDKLLDLNEIRSSAGCPQAIAHDARILTAFGYTREDLKSIIKPMVETAQEPVGSMGLDTPHAVLSQRPQLLFNYFKQLFAQVTNPAIDPIREELVMSLSTYLGPEKNLLEESPGHCHKLFLKRPILTARELEAIRSVKVNNFKTKAISILFKADGKDGLRDALKRINREAQEAVKSGSTFIILSDRGVDKNNAAIPSLLAVASVHHHLLRRGLRISAGIVLDSGEPREVQHFALLFGYGADAVHPYLALETAAGIAKEEGLGLKPEEAIERYIEAADKGILKVLSKMGISTLQSYRGAQIFEALGLNSQVTEEYFTGTVSRIGGAGLEVIAKETLLRHYRAFAKAEPAPLDSGGIYQWKKDGEFHLWNPESISCLQEAVRNNDPEKYREFSQSINDQSKNPTTLRGLFKFRAGAENIRPVPIEEVESAESIFKRFATGAMSFGSISRCAHETIAIAMNRLGGKSNTGEGGEDPQRFRPDASGDSRRSAIKQVASGRFGVTTNYLVNADELQIKIAQGAKPGEGGQLPGHKVSAAIARTRYTTEGVTLISPPPHHDIYSIEDLSQLIFDLKNVNPEARISVKLVSEIGVGTVAAGVAKGHAEMILISGGDGGTGASPLSSIRHAGLPWELGLSETHQTLLLNGLRGRVRLQTDGQMRTGRDVAIACLLGAEEFGFCTAVLITLGCVMLRHCHLNNCSVGVATQEECLEKRFAGKPEYIVNYFRFVAEELRRIMSSLGLRTIDEMVGRTDLLEVDKEILPWKAKGLDLSKILYRPGEEDVPKNHRALKNGLINDELLDFRLIELARPAFEGLKPVKAQLPISNTDRATGALLSGRVCKAFGEAGLKEDTIAFKFKGVAGQSFGAWLAGGVTLELEGLANDYVGKGISGGKIIAYPDRRASYISEENVIIGNTAFYGALSGEAYIRGRAGERFCIRNSGLNAVVEGVGDHGCEYMTGGRVVILGSTGRNFGAGMSGGIAYIYDAKGDFSRNCNPEMVDLEKVNEADAQLIRRMLKEHYRYTQSPCAASVLNDPDKELARFVKVMPKEYKRLLGEDHSVKVPDLAKVYSDG